jgi:tetratricopeptide (TPR) repeat protein
MSGMRNPRHLDDFTLLRYTAADLDATERAAVDEHLDGCARCSVVLESLAKLDEELRALAKSASATDGLDAADPFARRPEAAPRPAARPAGEFESLAVDALEASEKGGKESGRILEAAKGSAEELTRFLSELSLADLTVRFALLYALQESGRGIAESPPRALALALGALDLFRGDREEDLSAPAGRILPPKAIAAQAHLLAGQARTWSGELEKAKSHLEQAYAAFGDSTGDDTSLAIVELGESQRRAFAGDPESAFVLARRAGATFEEMGLEDFVARGRVAEAICLMKLDRLEEALEAYRSSLPVFQKHGLWSNYVGAINAAGATLSLLGRLDEARREYARALKVVSRKEHAAWVGYIRNGLALVLFKAGHYRDAAIAFLQTSRLFWETGNIANALTASLYEIESLALGGEAGRAARRFEIFRADVARHDALDPVIVRQLEAALSGSHPDLEEVAALRESAGQMLRERLETRSRA